LGHHLPRSLERQPGSVLPTAGPLAFGWGFFLSGRCIGRRDLAAPVSDLNASSLYRAERDR